MYDCWQFAQCFLLAEMDDLNDFVLDQIVWYLEPEKKIS